MRGEREEKLKTEYQPAYEYVSVRMRGDSMKQAGILDGSIMRVRLQRRYEDGDIVLFVRSENGKLKSYLRRAKEVGIGLILVPEGEGEPTFPIEGDFVIGVVVEVKTVFKKQAA